MITRLELKNFTAFRELDIDLSAKINVIIGEKGLITRMTKEIRNQLPVGKSGPRWANQIARGVAIVNFDLWNKRFTSWPVTRLGAAAP